MTCLILNGKAVCCMQMGNFDEAETLLLDALNKVTKIRRVYFNFFFCTIGVFKNHMKLEMSLNFSHCICFLAFLYMDKFLY